MEYNKENKKISNAVKEVSETLEEFLSQGLTLDRSIRATEAAVKLSNLTGSEVKKTCEGLCKAVESFHEEGLRDLLLDLPKRKSFLKECKNAEILTRNRKNKEYFEAFLKIFPILRMEGSWTGQENTFYLGSAEVAFVETLKGIKLAFRGGPSSGISFSTKEELGHLLTAYKDLESHILGVK